MHELDALSPLDGRYRAVAGSLAPYFSERALIRYRLFVEIEYLIALAASKNTALKPFSAKDAQTLRALVSPEIAEEIKKEETTTRHDVKALEYVLKRRLESAGFSHAVEWVHFALTSEDVNNCAYALALSDALGIVFVPKIQEIVSALNTLARTHAEMPMLARTHGQSASPTTFGKEMRVFAARIEKRLLWLSHCTIQAKLNGATGNWSAHTAAYPKADWVAFSEAFIEGLNADRINKLEHNSITTQIEWHDSYVAVFDTLRRINTILLDFDQDMWRYISDGWVIQATKEGEIGSSTMPHKVNPIDFENSEGNLGTANALFEFFARKLPISRLQRDLSDSTVERSMGSALGYTLLGYESLLRGLSRAKPDADTMRAALDAHPEVVAEAIQTVLRREGVAVPYEKLKELTRGKKITLDDISAFIDGLDVSDAVKKELHAFSPHSYIGLAAIIAKKT